MSYLFVELSFILSYIFNGLLLFEKKIIHIASNIKNFETNSNQGIARYFKNKSQG